MSKQKECEESKKNKIYRVGIDARFFGLENKGLGRYTKELIEHLDALNKKLEVESLPRQMTWDQKSIEYYIFLRKNNFDKYKPSAKNIHKVKADYKWYSWAEQLFFPRLINKYNLDLMHFTHFNAPIFYRKKFIVTIHDLILFHYPTIRNTTLNKLVYFFKLTAYHFAIRTVVKKANKIIAISEFTKQDIINSLKIKKEKIKVVYEGAEFAMNKLEKSSKEENTNVKNAIFKKYGIINKYLLYVGNAYPHKNLERLVLAFNKLEIKGGSKLQLVLVGKKDYFYEKLEKFIDENNIKNIIITDYISDLELSDLYLRTELFVFPSLYEGFGLPPLEALAKGVPVVSSSESSLREILQDKVIYFNPKSVKSIREGIEQALQNEKKILNSNDREKIKNKYSWVRMTKTTIEIYKKVINVKQ